MIPIATACTANAERRGLPICMKRMMGLETAVAMLGNQARLAEALNIDARSLRSKLAADRGVSDDDLHAAAAALRERAARIIDHADKMLALSNVPATDDSARPAPFTKGEIA